MVLANLEKTEVYSFGVLKNIEMNNEKKTNFDLYNDFKYTEAKWSFVDPERQNLYNDENKIINVFDPNKEEVS